MMDAAMLLPPTDTPLTGIDFTRRLPCGENERARKAMRVFFAIRLLSQQMSGTEERELPLTLPSNSGQVGDLVDLSECVRMCKAWFTIGRWSLRIIKPGSQYEAGAYVASVAS